MKLVKFCGVIFSAIYLFISVSSVCLALTPAERRRIARNTRGKVKTQRQVNYLKKHDLNKDGIVDGRDRYLWAKANESKVLVSYDDDEQYFLEELDINEDGTISSEELRVWKASHDEDGSGTISQDEL